MWNVISLHMWQCLHMMQISSDANVFTCDVTVTTCDYHWSSHMMHILTCGSQCLCKNITEKAHVVPYSSCIQHRRWLVEEARKRKSPDQRVAVIVIIIIPLLYSCTRHRIYGIRSELEYPGLSSYCSIRYHNYCEMHKSNSQLYWFLLKRLIVAKWKRGSNSSLRQAPSLPTTEGHRKATLSATVQSTSIQWQ